MNETIIFFCSQQMAVAHVVGIHYLHVRGLFSPDLHRLVERVYADQVIVQPFIVKQVEDVLARYEEQIRGGFIDEVNQVLWHLDSEHRVVWILVFKKVVL